MNITEVIDKLSEIKYNYDLEDDEFEALNEAESILVREEMKRERMGEL
jgi:hypothetical protein